jgi:hypothetical protein
MMLADKLLIVGYPYGYGAHGRNQPTPVVLTRFVVATRVSDGQPASPVLFRLDAELRSDHTIHV